MKDRGRAIRNLDGCKGYPHARVNVQSCLFFRRRVSVSPHRGTRLGSPKVGYAAQLGDASFSVGTILRAASGSYTMNETKMTELSDGLADIVAAQI